MSTSVRVRAVRSTAISARLERTSMGCFSSVRLMTAGVGGGGGVWICRIDIPPENQTQD